MEQQIVFGDSLAQLDDLRFHAVQANPFVAILAEDQRFAVFQFDRRVRFRLPVGGVAPRPRR